MQDRPGDGLIYSVLLSVPRSGGLRQWRAISDDFEHRLAAQESAAVIGPRIDREVRRGRDYVQVVVVMTVVSTDVGEALAATWWAFLEAAGDDATGWDVAGASAEVKPG